MAKPGGKSFSPTVFQKGNLNPKVICSTDAADVFSCEFNQDGEMIAASLSDGSVMVFETFNGSPVYKIPSINQEKLPATTIRFRPVDNELSNVVLVAYSSGHIYQWHIATGKSLTSTPEGRQTLAAAYSCDASTYASSGSDCKILIYDSSKGAHITSLESSSSLTTMDGHMNRVFALQYHPTDPNLLISGGWDDTVQFWDIRVSQSIRKISGPHICGNALDIEPGSFNIATGSWRYQSPLEVWDFASGKPLVSLNCISGTKLYSVCWLSERYLLVGGSQKHCASIIDIQNDKVTGDLKDITAGVYSVHYNKKTKMTGTASGSKIYLSPLNLPSMRSFITEYDNNNS